MHIDAHYEVHVNIVKYHDPNNVEFEEFKREFFHRDLIIAREDALLFYQNTIEDMLNAKGLEYVSDKQVRIALHDFFDPKFEHLSILR